jgi:hypothetical protein
MLKRANEEIKEIRSSADERKGRSRRKGERKKEKYEAI